MTTRHIALASLLLVAASLGYAAAASAASGGTRPGADWPRIAFADGSGSIALPPGWRISSAQHAAVEAQGPRGEGIALGITMPIGPPQFAAPGVMAAPVMAPAEAYAWVSEFTARRSGRSAQVRIVEARPTTPLTVNASSAFLLAEQSTQGRPYRSFALVSTAALGNGYWQYYMSLLTAPAEGFPEALPVMTAIWQSWGISQGEMNRRTAEAMLTMQETSRILRSTAEGRRTTDWHQQLTGLTLSGRWVIQDTETQERREVTSEQMNALFAAAPGRWRQLGAAEIGSGPRR